MTPDPENQQAPSAEPNPPATGMDKRARWALVAIAAALVLYMLMRPSSHPQDGSTAGTPQPEDDFINQSLAAYQGGRFQDCIAAAKQALAINPKSAEAFNNIAASYMSMHMPNEAFQNIQEALHLKPDFPLAQGNREWILREMKQAAAPGTPEAFVNESLQHYQAGRWKESLKAAQESLKLRPDYAEAHNNVAAAYAQLGRWDEAFTEINIALRLKPDFQLAKNNLAWISGERSKPSAAKK